MKKQFLLIIICSAAIFAQAQSIQNKVTASGGTSLSSGNYKIDFTLGETFINTLPAANNSITQGFHQPVLMVAKISSNDLPDVNAVAENEPSKMKAENMIDLSLKVYPNPVVAFLNIESADNKKLNITLSDASSKTLLQVNSQSGITQLDFTKYVSGNYFLTVTDPENKQATFKIIKLN